MNDILVQHENLLCDSSFDRVAETKNAIGQAHAKAKGRSPHAEKQKAARHTRSCDYRHLLLLLPFILSNLFRDEVEEHHRGNPVVDPSEELIGVTNIFLRWYKLFRQTTPGKTATEINTLRSLANRNCSLYQLYQLYSVF